MKEYRAYIVELLYGSVQESLGEECMVDLQREFWTGTKVFSNTAGLTQWPITCVQISNNSSKINFTKLLCLPIHSFQVHKDEFDV